MSNTFSLILSISTLITGIFWSIERLRLYSRRFNKICSFIKEKKHRSNSSIEFLFHRILNLYEIFIKSCSSIFPVFFLVFFTRSFIVEPFKIPSGSMMPTLLIGDMILVEKFSYGIKNPITQSTMIKIGTPKHGDIVVFKYPLDPSINYIKRVVGVPGDRVCYDPITKRLSIFSEYNVNSRSLNKIPTTYSNISPSNFVQIFSLTKNGKIKSDFIDVSIDHSINIGGIRLAQSKELFGNKEHNILMIPGHKDSLESYFNKNDHTQLTEWIVPKGEYFMMGDNRDNSFDSRYWGFVPEKNLVGKATLIWMSFEKQEGTLPTGVRLKRIGSCLH